MTTPPPTPGHNEAPPTPEPEGSPPTHAASTPAPTSTNARSTSRQIAALALPALGALIAEPIFVLIDSAMVGHLGTAPLAGLGVASTVLHTLVGIFVFLLFSTTTRAAQAYGRGDIPAALTTGIHALYLAGLIGGLLGIGVWASGPWILSFFDASPQALPHALAYLRASSPGIVGMFVVMAATGTLRGLHDTTSALVVASVGAALNVALNAAFIYLLNWGVAGSGAGTSITQLLMGATLIALLARRAQRLYTRQPSHEATPAPLRSLVSLRPNFAGVASSLSDGFPLLIRTIALRLALVGVVVVVTGMGIVALAAHHIVAVVWSFTAYALDALAVASQTLFASAMAATDTATDSTAATDTDTDTDTTATNATTDLTTADLHHTQDSSWATTPQALLRELTAWGWSAGVLIGLILAAASPIIPRFFSTDPHVWPVATTSLLIAAISMPIAGFVFLYDGVMMGADRTHFLAWAGVGLLAIHLPALWAVAWISAEWPPTWSLALLWAEFGAVFMGGRAAYLWVGSRELRA